MDYIKTIVAFFKRLVGKDKQVDYGLDDDESPRPTIEKETIQKQSKVGESEEDLLVDNTHIDLKLSIKYLMQIIKFFIGVLTICYFFGVLWYILSEISARN